jgi:transcriptional regulator with PAS, ATPase and Fis domain
MAAARTHVYDQSDATLDAFYTRDAVMQACLDRARVAARTDLPVLILGESGAGKTILARAIHNSSGRAAGPFVSFNAAALSDTLLDSQLFGHERGAFTGAQHRVKGKFELADLGTLFLDEIADLTLAAQSKILRAVEYGEFERLGSDKLLRADVRVMSATHYPIAGVAGGQFRQDLFFRISGITLTVPSLRERPNDLPVLLAAEIARENQRQKKSIAGLDRAAADRLLSYHWPGNLRELATVVGAAVALATGDVIGPEHLLLGEEGTTPARTSANGVSGFSRTRDVPKPVARTGRTLQEAIHRHITQVLEEVGGNKRRAARELGVSRATLDRKLREMSRAGSK